MQPVHLSKQSKAPKANTPLPQGSESLITPIVRSKRTPIACTECRRRQVKCSGDTPRCERCEKKGSKCEYIPIHQQKLAATAAAASAAPQNTVKLSRYASSQGSRSVPSSPMAWPQQATGYVSSYSDPSSSYFPPNEVQSHYVPTQTSSLNGDRVVQSAPAYVVPSAYGHRYQHSASSSYGQHAHDSLSTSEVYSQDLVMPAAHRSYSSPAPYDAYEPSPATSGVVLPDADAWYDYRTAAVDQFPASQVVAGATSEMSMFPEQYYPSQQGYHAAAAEPAGMPHSYDQWVNAQQPQTFSGFQGHSYA